MSTPLSPHGQWQVHQLGNYLQGQPAPTCFYSSPLQRAVQTARGVARTLGCSPQIDVDLQELHQGIFQGLTWAEAEQQHSEICAALTSTVDYLPVPEAETPMAAYQRAMHWYQGLWRRHGAGDIVWAISHSGFMQQLIRVIMGCDRTWQIPIRHTALFEFWLLSPQTTLASRGNPEYWKIIKFNETPHLNADSGSP